MTYDTYDAHAGAPGSYNRSASGGCSACGTTQSSTTSRGKTLVVAALAAGAVGYVATR